MKEVELRQDQMQTHCGIAETLRGTPIGPHEDTLPSGMQKDYVVLSAEERAKGFVEPLRNTYRHVGPGGPTYHLRDLTDEERERYKAFHYDKYEAYPPTSPETKGSVLGRFWTKAELERAAKGACGTTTTMGYELSATYARCPSFYGATYCCGCRSHFPVGEKGEFVWEGTAQKVGTTRKPHACDDTRMRPDISTELDAKRESALKEIVDAVAKDDAAVAPVEREGELWRCKECGARWARWADGSWSLLPNALGTSECGKCCDNARMPQ